MNSTEPPLTLYVHIPWCQKKCPYCDFNSHARQSPLPEKAYIEALLADLDQELPGVGDGRLHSIFIGGGTPSLLESENLDSIISGIQMRTSIASDAEITLEANPGSSDRGKFKEFKGVGINRLSIGVQSFNDVSLRKIGRAHNGHAARRAVTAAIAAGFDNFNLDLMYALPGQSAAMAADDVEQALSFEPPHLSCYQLTIEPNTVFAIRPPALPVDDTAWEMQRQLERRLGAEGYSNYEISAFALAGRHCRHNLNYWRFGDYVGIGAGAHGKLSRGGRVTRSWKVKNPSHYMNVAHSAQRVSGKKHLSEDEIGFEFMMNALRLKRPVKAALFQQRTGQPISRILPALTQARSEGLLNFDGAEISTTALGRRFLDDLLLRFLPEPEDRISAPNGT